MGRAARVEWELTRRLFRAGAVSFTRPPAVATGPIVSRTSGLFWITGAALVFPLSLLPQPAAAHPVAQRAIAVLALVGGAVVVVVGHRLPRWLSHGFNLVGTSLVTALVGLAGGGDVSAAYAVLFVIVPLDSFFFFGWLAAFVYLLWGMLALVVCAAGLHAVSGELALALGLMNLVAAVVVGVLVRAAGAGEVDPLTGVANRRGLQRLLATDLSRLASNHGSGRLSVALVDVDGFHELDETLGHAAADRMLRSVVDSWTPALPPRVTLARYGADVLALLLPGRSGEEAEAVVRALTGRLTAGQTVTAGIAEYRPADTSSLLLAQADTAAQQARHAGRGAVHVADRSRLGDAELRAALARDELRVVFQPIVDLATRGVVGAEALVRWEHPTRGVISPVDFIPVAEASGLIHQLGEQVLRRACREAAGWAPGADGQPSSVAVNVSGQELSRPGYLEQVVLALTDAGLSSSRLVLEVTESTLAADGAAALDCLRRLRDLGVGVAVDDFGTGYSSLARLERLPADTLKIDRAFVSAMDADRPGPVVTAIVALASALDLDLVAEGVENEWQAEALHRMGCRHGQGWLFGRPGPADAIAAALAANRPARAVVPVAP